MNRRGCVALMASLCATVGLAGAAWAQGPAGAPGLRARPDQPSRPAAWLKAVGATPVSGGASGPVVASIRVEATGQVSAVSVLRGDPSLNDIAVAALRPWTFERRAEAFDTVVMVNVLPIGGITFSLPPPPPRASDDVPLPVDPNFTPSGSSGAAGSEKASAVAAAAAPVPASGTPAATAPAPVRQMQMAPWRVGGPITMPTKLLDARPDYPADALDKRLQGTVVLEVVVGTDGSVHVARALSGAPNLAAAALAAVGHWVFSQTLMDGQPIPVLMTVTVDFSVK